MNLRMRNLILVALLSLAITNGTVLGLESTSVELAHFPEVWPPWLNPKQFIKIINNLPGGLDLSVHCKSKDDDLGVKLLHPTGEFEFSFRPNYVIAVTQFFCSFQWTGAFHYYDIYIQKRDQDRCQHCTWSIVESGPCLFNGETSKYDICDKWNPPVF